MQNKKGAVLVFVLLIGSVMIVTGTALLSTAAMNYKMKRLNSQVKHVFYTCEAVMEEAYIMSVEYIEDALTYARGKEQASFEKSYINFLKGNCMDLPPSGGIVGILKDKSRYILYKDNCYRIDSKLLEKIGFYQLEIISTYSENNIEKQLKLICEINTPEMNDNFPFLDIVAEDLIDIVDWKVER